MKLIGRYLLHEVVRMSLMVLVALVGLFLFFELVGELSSVGKGDYGFLTMLLFVLLRAPGYAYELLPIAALIGGLFSLSLLNQHAELTVMRTAGLTVRRLLAYLAAGGGLLAVFTFALGEWVAPMSGRAASQVKLAATGKVVTQDFRSGFWARDGDSFINVHEVLPDASLRWVSVYEFDAARRLVRFTRAETGHFQPSRVWTLNNVTVTTLDNGSVRVQHLPTQSWQSVLSPDMLAVLLIAPEQMSASGLMGYIQHLERNNQKTNRYEIALWGKLFYPLSCIALILMALPFAATQKRAGNIGLKLMLGIMIGLGFFIGNEIVKHLGLLYDWPPLLTALLPSTVFLMCSFMLLALQERR
jgi:lipopolysaccharide export system permease protein